MPPAIALACQDRASAQIGHAIGVGSEGVPWLRSKRAGFTDRVTASLIVRVYPPNSISPPKFNNHRVFAHVP